MKQTPTISWVWIIKGPSIYHRIDPINCQMLYIVNFIGSTTTEEISSTENWISFYWATVSLAKLVLGVIIWINTLRYEANMSFFWRRGKMPHPLPSFRRPGTETVRDNKIKRMDAYWWRYVQTITCYYLPPMNHIEMPFMISVDFLLQTTNTVFCNLSLHVVACTC